MIILFWIYAACLLDTPERRIKMEVRRITEALEKYNKAQEQKKTPTRN